MEPAATVEPGAGVRAAAKGGTMDAKVAQVATALADNGGQAPAQHGGEQGQGGKWIRKAGRFDGASDWEWV